MDNTEFIVLLNFLKSGLSTRHLDMLLGHNNTRGWKSWDILKKYKLRDTDKRKLFLYSTKQSKKIITKLITDPEEGLIDFLIKDNSPSNLEKYRNTYVLARSEKSFYNILSGETRNLIRDFFNPKKKLIGKCQYKACNIKNSQIDTVHFNRDRPEIFIQCAIKNKSKDRGNLIRFNVYNTMKCFLMSHSKQKSVCFLCKNHHNEFHRAGKIGKIKLTEFKRKIMF